MVKIIDKSVKSSTEFISIEKIFFYTVQTITKLTPILSIE